MEENNFSTFIKELRMEKGLSQEELAKALYVHRTTVNKWENDNVIPLNDKLLLIADYFDISVDELLNGKRSDINNASLTRNNTIVELIKSKTRSQKLLIYSVLVTLILILGFLAYYFISNYNSIKLYRVYGENKNIRTRDGLLFFSKDKIYFKPGNFYDVNDNIVSVDLIRLYYFDENNNEVILLTGASKNLIIEKEKSRETFVDRIYRNEKFYMDACYKNTCQKMELSYFNDFSNDNLINDEVENKSVRKINMKVKSKDDLINSLIQNGFTFNENDMSYVKNDDDVVYSYLTLADVIYINSVKKESNFLLKIYLNTNTIIVDENINLDNMKNIYISDYTNKKDKNYNTFKKYYDRFLSKYFRDFLVVLMTFTTFFSFFELWWK